jgi:hypothetical protein
MIGCYLSASGKQFDVDTFLEDSSFDPEVVHYYGDQTRLPGRVCESSGFALDINDVFGQLTVQIPSAIQFLRDQQQELRRLTEFPGVTDVRIVFTYCPGNVATRDEYFPPELVRLAGSLSIGIGLSIYPGDFDPAEFTCKAN